MKTCRQIGSGLLVALLVTQTNALHCCPSGYRATTDNLAGGCALADTIGNWGAHGCIDLSSGGGFGTTDILRLAWDNHTNCGGNGCGYYQKSFSGAIGTTKCTCPTVASMTDCATLCDSNPECGAFEYDAVKQECWVVFREEGIGPTYPMWTQSKNTPGGFEACVKGESTSDCTYNSYGDHTLLAGSYQSVDCTEGPQEAPCSSSGGVWGDPHVVTWSGKVIDFMGECDLVMVKSDKYQDGKGLEVQIRTEIQGFWSITSAVAVKIDTSVLEVHNSGKYYLDGTENVDLFNTGISGHSITRQSKHVESEVDWVFFSIHLANGANLHITVRNNLLDVNFENATYKDFGDSIGLMGSFSHRKMLGRDGQTVFMNNDFFGQEWQVHKGDKLFMDDGAGPQHPAQCNFPSEARKSFLQEQRKLRGGQSNFAKKAEEACAAWPLKTRAACIFDVLATGDLTMAIQNVL